MLRLTISATALDKQDGVFFKSMLQLVHLHLNATWEFAEVAEVVVVDIENPEGEAFWRTPPENTLLIAYAKSNFYNAEWFLKKPIRVQPLIQLLNAITALKTTSTVTPQVVKKPVLVVKQEVSVSPPIIPTAAAKPIPAAIPPVPQEVSTIKVQSFDPSRYLLGLLQKSLESGQVKQFRCSNLPPLYVLPSERRCFTAVINMGQLTQSQKMLYGAFAEHIESVDLSKQQLLKEAEQQTLRAYPIETLLWLTALHSSHGRLIHELKENQFFRLKRWPNFIILPHQPIHVNLAAFMLKHTADLQTITVKTMVPLPGVVDFLNACYVIGLITVENNTEDKEDKTLSEPKKYLLKTILKRLLQYE